MKDLRYIVRRIDYQWLNLRWFWMWPLLIYELCAWPSISALLLAAALGYWIARTWPKRWALAIPVAVVLFQTMVWQVRALVERYA